MSVELIRILQYTYPDLETADKDLAQWQVPAMGTCRLGLVTIRSAITPNFIADEDNANRPG